jgi:hypothetical protein
MIGHSDHNFRVRSGIIEVEVSMKIYVLVPEQGEAKAYFNLPPDTQRKGTRLVVAEVQDFPGTLHDNTTEAALCPSITHN